MGRIFIPLFVALTLLLSGCAVPGDRYYASHPFSARIAEIEQSVKNGETPASEAFNDLQNEFTAIFPRDIQLHSLFSSCLISAKHFENGKLSYEAFNNQVDKCFVRLEQVANQREQEGYSARWFWLVGFELMVTR